MEADKGAAITTHSVCTEVNRGNCDHCLHFAQGLTKGVAITTCASCNHCLCSAWMLNGTPESQIVLCTKTSRGSCNHCLFSKRRLTEELQSPLAFCMEAKRGSHVHCLPSVLRPAKGAVITACTLQGDRPRELQPPPDLHPLICLHFTCAQMLGTNWARDANWVVTSVQLNHN